MRKKWTQVRGSRPPYDLAYICPWYWGNGEDRGTYFIDLTNLSVLGELELVSAEGKFAPWC